MIFLTDYWLKVYRWTFVFNTILFVVIGGFVFEFKSWVDAGKMFIFLIIAQVCVMATAPIYAMFFRTLSRTDEKQQLEDLKKEIDEKIGV